MSSSSFVAATCPPNSHYSQCANTCGGSCANFMTPFGCTKSCFEGCQCDAGFVSDGSKCVALENCGCVYAGRYLTVKLCYELTTCINISCVESAMYQM